MTIAADEALACLNVLIAVAKADGKVKADERKSLAAAISGFELPPDTSVEALLAADIDVAAELAKVASSEAKEQVYRSAHFLANADGSSAPEEQALLARIEAATAPSDELRSRLAALAASSARGSFVDSIRAFFRTKN
jgi:tellurite resistance protein